MADLHASLSQPSVKQVDSATCGRDGNGDTPLEAQLRQLFARQRQLREQLDATRAELDRVNAEVLRTGDEYCSSPEREEEYLQGLEKILGYDPRIDPKEIEEALKNPQSFEDFLAELEQLDKQ